MTARRRRFHPRVLADIVKRQDGKCACGCGEALGTDPRDIQFDHANPLWNGGKDDPENLRALKKKHHLAKTVRETKDRAKMKRIVNQSGMIKRRMSRRDEALAHYLEND